MKCQFECIVYKVEVHSRGSNDSCICRKKSIRRFHAGILKKDISIIEVAWHTKYIDMELVYLCGGNHEKPKYRSYIKMRDNNKNAVSIKGVDKCCNLCMGEKLPTIIPMNYLIKSRKNLNVCWHKKNCLLGW